MLFLHVRTKKTKVQETRTSRILVLSSCLPPFIDAVLRRVQGHILDHHQTILFFLSIAQSCGGTKLQSRLECTISFWSCWEVALVCWCCEIFIMCFTNTENVFGASRISITSVLHQLVFVSKYCDSSTWSDTQRLVKMIYISIYSSYRLNILGLSCLHLTKSFRESLTLVLSNIYLIYQLRMYFSKY
jgi:hypothetical protein